ncbi:MAG: CHASE2 domain-containing protein [Rhizomicrobium sp.]
MLGFVFATPKVRNEFQGRPLAIWALPGLVLAAALFLLGSDAGAVASRLRGVLFDSYQRAQPRAYQDTLPRAGFAVRTLEADAPSLKRFGKWPWPHGVLAKLVGDLKAQGAAMAVLAFPLDAPDPASPKNLVALVPAGTQNDALRAALGQMASPDAALVQAMDGLATVTGLTLQDVPGRARAQVQRRPCASSEPGIRSATRPTSPRRPARSRRSSMRARATAR